jgi:hypothetical protein
MANALTRIVAAVLLVSCPVACTHGPWKRVLPNWPSGAGRPGGGDAAGGRQDVTTAAVAAVHIQNVRLDFVAAVPAGPSAFLKFTMLNQGSTSVADVVLRVSLVGTDDDMDSGHSHAIVAGPYVIRSKPVLLPGYSVDFDLGLDSVGSDCGCIGTVEVVAARFAPQPSTATSEPGTSVIADRLCGRKEELRRAIRSSTWIDSNI